MPWGLVGGLVRHARRCLVRPKFDDYVRAGSLTAAILVVSYLAVTGQSEAAAGALIGLVGMASSWMFRGKVESPKA